MAITVRFEGFCLICNKYGDERTLRQDGCATERQREDATCKTERDQNGVTWFKWSFPTDHGVVEWLLLRERRR